MRFCHIAAWTWQRVPLWSASGSGSRLEGPGRCMTAWMDYSLVGCSGGFWGGFSKRWDAELRCSWKQKQVCAHGHHRLLNPPLPLKYYCVTLSHPKCHDRKSLVHIPILSIIFASAPQLILLLLLTGTATTIPPHHCLFAWLRRSQSSNTALTQTTPVTATWTSTPSVRQKAVGILCA